MIFDNDVNILFTPMVPGSYTETRRKKVSFTHGYQTRFIEFPQNKRYHVSYLLILVANVFFQLSSVKSDEVSILKSNIMTHLIRNGVIVVTPNHV